MVNKANREHNFKVGKVRSSKGVYCTEEGREFEIIPIEVDGITHYKRWDSDTVMEPWLIDQLLESSGYVDDMPNEIIKNFCLNQIRFLAVEDKPLTKGDLDLEVAYFCTGWEACRNWMTNKEVLQLE